MMSTLTRRVAVDDAEAERGIAALYAAMRALSEATSAMVIGVESEANHQLASATRMLDEIRRIAIGHSDQELADAVERARRVVAALKAVKL